MKAAVHTIDLGFQGKAGAIAAHLIETTAGLVLIDCGPGSTLAALLAGIRALGYAPHDLKYLLLTHIHLDHAGAAGRLAHDLGLQVMVHRAGAKHLLQPARLIESASRIYGALMEPLWGEFLPVPAGQLRVLEPQPADSPLVIGDCTFEAIYTPGHAIHHLAYALGDRLFVGDVAGVRLNSPVVIAPTPPPDIDLVAWRNSIALLEAQQPQTLYLAHFGAYHDPVAHFTALKRNLDLLEDTTQQVLGAGGDRTALATALAALVGAEIAGVASQSLSADLRARYQLATPHQMAADGLLRAYGRQR
jgi:glyoxylase-like metal-dependent hydrolase (beta-lactamase superfamily II)